VSFGSKRISNTSSAPRSIFPVTLPYVAAARLTTITSLLFSARPTSIVCASAETATACGNVPVGSAIVFAASFVTAPVSSFTSNA
jgi:hypothetical protein